MANGSPKKVTERDMLNALDKRYGSETSLRRYVRAEHVRSSLGFQSARTLDFMAVDTWGSTYGSDEYKGPYIHGHEVKVSRSDWLTELKDPDKSGEFIPYMHYFWLVVSDKDIVKPGELPKDWGLMVKYGESTRVITAARKLTPIPMTLLRHAALLKAAEVTAEYRAQKALQQWVGEEVERRLAREKA